MKSRAEQLDEMSEAILAATDRIRYYKQQDKMLQSEIKRLTRNERTHRSLIDRLHDKQQIVDEQKQKGNSYSHGYENEL